MKTYLICVTIALTIILLINFAPLSLGGEVKWGGTIICPVEWLEIETWTGTVATPPVPIPRWHQIEVWESFNVVLVFRDPRGNPISGTEIYYGFSIDKVTSSLGYTDEEGKIVLEDPKLANRIVIFTTSDRKYAGAVFIPIRGEITAELIEVSRFPTLRIIATLVVTAAAAGIMMFVKKRKREIPVQDISSKMDKIAVIKSKRVGLGHFAKSQLLQHLSLPSL